MKAIFRITFLIAAFTVLTVTGVFAQRVIKGTVYREGQPAAGITVEVHRGGTMMTSFDGKYEVEANSNSKWIKFTYITESKRLDISGQTGDVFDFAFDGDMPSDDAEEEVTQSGDVILKSAEELIREQDRDFMNELSIYNEFYKQKNYESALPHWNIVYTKYPKATINIYIHGANMYETFIENAATPQEKDKYVDELMKLYDKRIKYFGESGYVLGRKATAWLKHKLNTDNPPEDEALKSTLKKGYDWLSRSIEEQGEKTELPVVVLLMQTTRSLFKLGELPKETVVKNYDNINKVLNALIEKNEDAELVQSCQDIKQYVEDIFGSSGAADCEALVNIFTPQFNENNNDIEFIKGMLRRLGKANCEETALFSQATEKLYELDPSAEAAFNMARRYLKRNDIEKAKDYYKEAMDQETDKGRLADYYYEYATLVFAKENALSEARTFARKAVELNPEHCQALMLIGDIYVAASRSFGQDAFEKSTVFWIAVDYFEKARRAGQDCAVDASQKAATYRRYFPNKEEAFFRSMQEGNTYTVGGWINESTRVRF
jgi:tetratricopeptide (TPR) repeat protein